MAQIIPGHSIALRCLGNVEGPRFLDGRTGDGSVGLAPNTDPPFTGTHWCVADNGGGQIVLACAGDVDGTRLLDGRTGDGSVGLAPDLDAPFSGTRWQPIDDGSGNMLLRCMGTVEGPRFLDGRTGNGSVGLAPATTPPFTGTHWQVVDFGPLPTEVRFDVDSISFPTGIPVGGFTHLTLRQNGSFTFSGHFHDSGGVEFNTGLVFGVKDLANQVFTFQHSGHVSGTFEPGSRDDDWSIDSQDSRIAQNWPFLALAARGHWDAKVNVDMTNLTNEVIGGLGLVTGVIGIVVAL